MCRFCISTITGDTSRHAFAVLVPSMKISAVVADFEIRYDRQAAPFFYRKFEALGGSRYSREQVRPTRVKGREYSAVKGKRRERREVRMKQCIRIIGDVRKNKLKKMTLTTRPYRG